MLAMVANWRGYAGVTVWPNARMTAGVGDFLAFCLDRLDDRPRLLTVHFSGRAVTRRYGTFIWRRYRPQVGDVYIYTRIQSTREMLDTIAHELAHAEDYALGFLRQRYDNARGNARTTKQAENATEDYANTRAAELVAAWWTFIEKEGQANGR